MRGNRAKQQQFLGLIQIVDSVPAGYGNINLEGKWKCMKLNCWGSCQSVKRNMDQCRIDMSGWVLSYQHVVMRISYILCLALAPISQESASCGLKCSCLCEESHKSSVSHQFPSLYCDWLNLMMQKGSPWPWDCDLTIIVCDQLYQCCNYSVLIWSRLR